MQLRLLFFITLASLIVSLPAAQALKLPSKQRVKQALKLPSKQRVKETLKQTGGWIVNRLRGTNAPGSDPQLKNLVKEKKSSGTQVELNLGNDGDPVYADQGLTKWTMKVLETLDATEAGHGIVLDLAQRAHFWPNEPLPRQLIGQLGKLKGILLEKNGMLRPDLAKIIKAGTGEEGAEILRDPTREGWRKRSLQTP